MTTDPQRIEILDPHQPARWMLREIRDRARGGQLDRRRQIEQSVRLIREMLGRPARLGTRHQKEYGASDVPTAMGPEKSRQMLRKTRKERRIGAITDYEYIVDMVHILWWSNRFPKLNARHLQMLGRNRVPPPIMAG